MGGTERKEGGAEGEGEEEEERLLLGGMAVLDFDMLCATVASQTHGFSVEKMVKEEGEEEGGGEVGGVQRMWEGDVLDCFEDRRIAIETACCPCYRFGKNMGRANLGPCLLQGTIYSILTVAVLFIFIAYGITEQQCYLYVGMAFFITAAIYLGYFQTRIRKQFNIRGSDSGLDDCVNHLICSCCALCQESRTLEMNNVQDGVWRGRGDTICIGSFGEGSKAFSELRQPPLIPTKSPGLCNMERATEVGSHHSCKINMNHSEPLVPSAQSGPPLES